MGMQLTSIMLNGSRNSQKNGQGTCGGGTLGALLVFISKLA